MIVADDKLLQIGERTEILDILVGKSHVLKIEDLRVGGVCIVSDPNVRRGVSRMIQRQRKLARRRQQERSREEQRRHGFQ